MTTRNRYFIDFEFDTGLKRYWLPLFINATSIDEASELALRFKTALQERYEIIHASSPLLVVKDLNLDRIEKYSKRMFRGKVATLDVTEWHFTEIPGISEFAFDKRLDLAIQLGHFNTEGYITTGRRRRYQVGVIQSRDFINLDEILIIDLVMPAEGDKSD